MTIFETIRPRREGEPPLEIDSSKEKILVAYQSVANDIDNLEGIDENEEEQFENMIKIDKEFTNVKSRIKVLEKKLHKIKNITTNEINNITSSAELECGEEL